jgi:RNA polymerase sigma factor (sigma-70 family)
VRSLAREFLGAGQSADDVMQEAWLAGFGQTATIGSPLVWLQRVLRNKSLQHWRAEARRSKREQAMALAEAQPDAGHALEEREMKRAILNALDDLGDRDRRIVTLRNFEDLA